MFLSTLSLPLLLLFHESRNTEGGSFIEGVLFSITCGNVSARFVHASRILLFLDLKCRCYVMDSALYKRVQCDHDIQTFTIHDEKSYIYMGLLCPFCFLPSYRHIIIYWRKEKNIRLALYVVLFMFQ